MNLRFVLCCSLLWTLSLGASSSEKLPRSKDFQKCVLWVLRKYSTKGVHRYYWPKGKKTSWAGTTCDLRYRKKLICKGDAKKRAYCCGLTFEVFFKAYQLYCKKKKIPFRILNFSPRKVLKVRKKWYGADGDKRGCQGAIVVYKLGRAIKKLFRAKKGDFVQFWRKSGSGHSVIFMGWVIKKRKIVGLKYWSTQKSTRGIGYRTETIYGKRGIDLKKIYIARVGRH